MVSLSIVDYMKVCHGVLRHGKSDQNGDVIQNYITLKFALLFERFRLKGKRFGYSELHRKYICSNRYTDNKQKQNEAFDLPSEFRQTSNEWFIMTVILQYILIGSYIQDRVLDIIPNLH